MGLYEEKIALLRNIDIFSELREYELEVIARYSDIVNYAKRQIIFSFGSQAEALYVVNKGRVGIINVENEDITIAQIIENESFGEFDFFGNTLRNATAIAEEDTTLLQFPSKEYEINEVYKKYPFISASMLYRLLGIISKRIWRINVMLHEKTRWLQDLHKQLLSDKMTGLYNQTYLKEDFINLLDLGSQAALLIIKPDNFKEINDIYGHEAGDQALNLIAIFLQSELDENDIGIRFRGDEFAAILTHSDKDKAVERAKNISRTIKSINLSGIISSDTLRIKVSIGIALFPKDAKDSKDLIECSHRRMMNARTAGGSRIII